MSFESPSHAPGARTARRTSRGCVALAIAASVVACRGPASSSTVAEAEVDRALAAYGVDPAPASRWSAVLGWQAPSPECPHTYRLTAHYEPAQKFESDSRSDLVIGPHPRRLVGRERRAGAADGTIRAHLYYKGIGAERVGATRDVYFTREMVGPASPTAACMHRTWDPMEDALALGWPRLTGRLTGVDEQWSGLSVGGRCNRSACVDPQTGAGGPSNHDRTCVTPPWRESLEGLFVHRGELYAWVHSEWSDGQPPGQGISTERHTLLSVDHGRPLWSRTRIDHRFSQLTADDRLASVVRTWTLESSDGCAGSLAAAGWDRPPQMVEREGWLREQLARVDELRRAPSRRAASE